MYLTLDSPHSPIPRLELNLGPKGSREPKLYLCLYDDHYMYHVSWSTAMPMSLKLGHDHILLCHMKRTRQFKKLYTKRLHSVHWDVK
jgi:L-ribulose-5-phosphate 3-epimerase UlaE